MAGEIYIADKETLDKVNNKVDLLLEESDQVSQKISKDTISVSDLLSKVKHGYHEQNSLTSDVAMLNITSPGTLYYIVAGSNASSMKITVDGVVIYNRELSGLYARSGIMHFPSGTYFAENYSFPSNSRVGLGGDIVSTNGSTSPSSVDGVLIITRPLKFNTLNVTVKPVTGASSSETRILLDYYYILD